MTSQSLDFIDVELLDHARRGLARVHRAAPTTRDKDEGNNRKVHPVGSPTKSKVEGPAGDAQNNGQEKIISYISLKAPPKRTVFYEHSKRGLKYWYDDSSKKSFQSKSILGRTGTLLGLVDSPYK